MDEQSSASEHDCASDSSAIGAGFNQLYEYTCNSITPLDIRGILRF